MNRDQAAPIQKVTRVDLLQLARQHFLACERLDIRQLSEKLGINRVTVYRWVGDRDQLAAEVLWDLAQFAMAQARKDVDEHQRDFLHIFERYIRYLGDSPALAAFLKREPQFAIRVLTSPSGFLQIRLHEAFESLLTEEHERHELAISPDTLAYIVIRIGESFIYPHISEGIEPDFERALKAVALLLR
ncbi:QsdR family transcriptional regulator [Marinobacter halotolerans]|uniref:QsdR family transcriptional regulator n=1 Tax=Marinobacter halotolerans TaxID=1569211 RepID=UPI001246F842|nr:QsdR family transcriptional regulator [Marinobacter halotolerans]